MRCRLCGGKCAPLGGDLFRCGKCGAAWDSDPDEGGTYSDDPTRRIEQDERRQANQRRKH